MMAGRVWLPRYLDWIDDNRDRILEDAGKPLQVLNDEHKFYFTSSYNPDTPNIGYVIGTLYVRYLHQRHSLHELRTFGKQDDLNRESFAAFLSEWTWDGRV